MRLRRKSSPSSSPAKPTGLPPVPIGQRGRQLGSSVPHVHALRTDADIDQLRLRPEVERWLGIDQGNDGFMPPHMAAVAMNVSEAELAAMVDRGWLSCRAVGSAVWKGAGGRATG